MTHEPKHCDICKDSNAILNCTKCTLKTCEPCIDDWFKNSKSGDFTCPQCRGSKTFSLDYDTKYPPKRQVVINSYNILDHIPNAIEVVSPWNATPWITGSMVSMLTNSNPNRTELINEIIRARNQ
jgi:hypothetical protein